MKKSCLFIENYHFFIAIWQTILKKKENFNPKISLIWIKKLAIIFNKT